MVLATVSSAASSLLDYEKRVKRATEQIERMKTDESYAEEAIPYVKDTLLPKSEQVEMKYQTVTVNNTWLHTELDAYTNARVKKEKDRILDEIHGSLKALDKHLRDIEGINGNDSTDGDQQLRNKIRGILSQEQYREKKESFIAAKIKEIRQQINRFINRLLTKIFSAIGGGGKATSWLLIVLLAFLVGIISYLIYNYFTTKGRVRRPRKKTVLGEEIAEDAKPSDLADAALAAAKSGDFRLGIRKLYIALLYELSERGLIELDANATNQEYLQKISRFTPLLQPMHYLTDRFDYFWYGMFPSTQEDFSTYLTRYREAVRHAERISEQQRQTV